VKPSAGLMVDALRLSTLQNLQFCRVDKARRTMFGLAVTPADLEETLRIRYRVYCEEFGYESPERFPDGMEADEFDEAATHCLVTHNGSGLAAGCVRICPASVKGSSNVMPYEKWCSGSLDEAPLIAFRAPREHLCEASRFAVDGIFRRRPGEAMTRFGKALLWELTDSERRTFPLISVGLTLGAAVMAERLKRPNLFALMEPFLPRLLTRFGVHFHRVGRDIDYHGIRAVYAIDTDEFVRTMGQEFRQLYSWITESVQNSQQLPSVLNPCPMPGNLRVETRLAPPHAHCVDID
jgi:N-acyl amino acid synthase of PEP-CTERM/exosortase system